MSSVQHGRLIDVRADSNLWTAGGFGEPFRIEFEERLRSSEYCTGTFAGDWYLQKYYWQGPACFSPGWEENANNLHLDS